MKCLTPECYIEKIFARGVCEKCYRRLFKRVRRCSTTWGELIDQGAITRATRKGASLAVRRNAQIEGKKELHQSMSADDKVFLDVYRRWLKQGYKITPGDLSPEEKQLAQEQLRLAGDKDDN